MQQGKIRRKYIALSSSLSLLVLVLFTYVNRSSSNAFLGPVHWYIGLPVSLFSILLTSMLFGTKKEQRGNIREDTKNTVVTMSWIITLVYFIFFIYFITVDPNAPVE